MRAFVLFFFSFFAISTFSQVKNNSTGFIENKGQIVDQKSKPNPSVKYLLNTNGLNVQLREKGFSYDVYETEKNPLTKKDKDFYSSNPNFDNGIKTPDYSLKYKYHRIDIDFLNANPNTQLIAEEKSKDYDNYYNIVHSPEGIINVHKFQKVTYKNIYNQIDVVFFIPNDSTKAVEYNFIIKPGGKISDIQLQFRGGKTELVENKIRMQLRFGGMEETIPMSWTEQKNGKSEIKINYKKIKKNVYGFEGDLNSSEKTIVIDPVPIRLWGTYYGNGSNFNLLALENDNFDNLYFSGITNDASNIATNGSHDNTLTGFSDGFLVKFDPNGVRIWGTYYGGNNSDAFHALKESNNELVLTGVTNSPTNISTPGAFKETLTLGGHTNSDVFIVKFNLNGQRIWGTYFGGENNDYPLNLELDQMNNIIIVGSTYSINGISTPGTFKDYKSVPVNEHTVGEGFIAKFNTSGFQIWGSYYFLCEIRGLGIDSNSNIFFSGDVGININNFTTTGTHQPNIIYNTNSSYSSFLIKFDPFGQRVWGTYYGKAREYNHCLKVDHNDDILISGYTRSTELISTTNAHQPNLNLNIQNPSDAYLAKFNQSGQLIWGTYYGGDNQEDLSNYTIDIDENNNIFFAGNTDSTNNISTIGSQNFTPNGWYDTFIVKFNPSGIRLWGTYFGGNNGDFTTTIKYNRDGEFYIAGNTYSTNNISTVGSHQPSINNPISFFIEKFKDCQSSTSVNSNSPICIGNNLELSASGGTNYSWTGPNGFTSTDQNPIILNSNASHSGQYSCEITGTGDCDNTVTINVVVGDFETPIPTNTNLPVITGDCNTVISTIPTASDNCAGTIIATTTNPLTYSIPGSYTITWNYNDGNGNTSSQTQNVTISSVALPTPTSEQQFCIQENATLNNIVISGQNIKWYDAITSGNLLPITTLLQNGTTYYASQTINGCESARVPVLVTIQNTAAPTGNQNQSFCSTENATLNNIAVTGTDVIWYNSLGGSTILSTSTLLQNGGTYYASQTINGCESPTRLAVSIQLINTLNANNYSEAICDDLNNRTEIVNLSSYNGALIASSGNIFKYYYSLNGAQNQLPADEIQNSNNYNLLIGNNIVYVRIESPNTCFQIVTLDLNLVSKPFVNINDVMPICEGSSITIDAGSGFDNYLWSTNDTNNSITITQPGNYSVIVSENHGSLVCSTTKNFTVVNSNIGTISEIITSDWTQNENTISVLLSSNSSGNYEYSLNGIDFQDNNTFYGLENGEYTVYVRDKNGCGVSSEDVYVLMYPKFFTPNGDGYNDYWKIKLSENEPNISITIFDRYGKLIKQFDSTSNGWDGTLNNKALPATDYWFVVIREGGKEHRGHFTLKR